MNLAPLTPTPISAAIGAAPIKRRKRRATNKSTATEAQYDRILEMLRTGPKNTYELRGAGISQPAARILELNRYFDAYIPRCSEINMVDEWGFSHRGIAVYELIDEPNYVREGVVQ